jgi:hypothetical protein
MTSFWSGLLKTVPDERLTSGRFRLPLIIPIVLYNGKDRWTVPQEFASLYAEDVSLFKPYVLNFKYHLIDVNAYKPEDLLESGTFLATIFYMDLKSAVSKGTEYGAVILERLGRATPNLERFSLQECNLFLHWMEAIMADRLADNGECGGSRAVAGSAFRSSEAARIIHRLLYWVHFLR